MATTTEAHDGRRFLAYGQDARATRSPGEPFCAVGIPVVPGVPATPMPENFKGLFQVAMRFVERNDYHGLMELGRCGFSKAFDERRRCVFVCDLKPGACMSFEGTAVPAMPQCLDVRSASLLHYAVCMGAFDAAAALVVMCPGFLQTRCNVLLSSKESSVAFRWGPADLIRFFCRLYSTGETSPDELHDAETDIVETRDFFSKALPIFEMGEEDPLRLPFLALPDMTARIAAAGFASQPIIAAFCAASNASLNSGPMDLE